MADEHPARAASLRSRQAVESKNKEAWLALFADDALIEDPVGRSPIDPEGRGHRGKAAISAFWDRHIAQTQIEFDIRHSYAAGDEVANVGAIKTKLANGMRGVAEGVFIYKVNAEGKLISLRAIWEFDKMMASLTPAE